MSITELPINIDREKIAAFCRARGIPPLEPVRLGAAR